jgi:hypothetical protein
MISLLFDRVAVNTCMHASVSGLEKVFLQVNEGQRLIE